MRWQIFLMASLFFVLTASLVARVQAAEAEGVWRLDAAPSAEMPRNFRLMTDAVSFGTDEPSAREGLDTLRCSASAQPTGEALPRLYAHLRERAGEDAPIYLVDLRQESHGFVNDAIPVSWCVDRNWGNYGMGAEDAERHEEEQLAALCGSLATFVPKGNYDIAHLDPMTVHVASTETERVLSERAGFRYFRIAATDQAAPDDEAVDAFLRFVSSLPPSAWLHFHCHAGHGRTTTFLVFYDILNNPDVPLETIAARQYILGGTDLLAPVEGDGWRADQCRARAESIRAFYAYVQENRAQDFRISFAQWRKATMETSDPQ